MTEEEYMIEALIKLSNWPERSSCYDGTISKHAAENVANIRRFARETLNKIDERRMYE